MNNDEDAKSLHASLQYAKDLIEDSYKKIKKFNDGIDDGESQSEEQTYDLYNQVQEEDNRNERFNSRKSSYKLPTISMSNAKVSRLSNSRLTPSNKSSIKITNNNLPKLYNLSTDQKVKAMIESIDKTLMSNNETDETLQKQINEAKNLLDQLPQCNYETKKLEEYKFQYKALNNKLEQPRTNQKDKEHIEEEVKATKKRVQELIDNVCLLIHKRIIERTNI